MIRLNRVRAGEIVIITTIHPRWAIEEKAIIFRSWVWFRPPSPPIIVDVIPRAMVMEVGIRFEVMMRRVIGAIFCHVVMMRAVSIGTP